MKFMFLEDTEDYVASFSSFLFLGIDDPLSWLFEFQSSFYFSKQRNLILKI